ncbi:MAG: hypothetical protein JWO42_3472 [Chloroflexi bacterium]|jgi:hypothetical protein|nr:hypothetical protein [Chloroflexota bacterium]
MSFNRDPLASPAHPPAPPSQPSHVAPDRWHGARIRPRHQGVVHHPHAHTLEALHGLHHPHHGALARAHPAAHSGRQGAHPAQVAAHGHHSRIHLAARPGLQKIEVASIQSYNAAANTAQVRILGAQANLIGPLPLGEGLSPTLAVPGATCLVVLLDEANPADAAIVAIYNAPPQPWSQAGSAALNLASYQIAQTVSFPAAFSTSVLAVTATSRHPDFVASVSGETLTGFVLSLTRREGASQLQSGVLNVPVAAGASSGSAPLVFPSAFAVARSVSASSSNGNWHASVSGLSAGGCTLTVSSTALGPVTITVYWQATGDPAVSLTVAVDWQALGV